MEDLGPASFRVSWYLDPFTSVSLITSCDKGAAVAVKSAVGVKPQVADSRLGSSVGCACSDGMYSGPSLSEISSLSVLLIGSLWQVLSWLVVTRLSYAW